MTPFTYKPRDGSAPVDVLAYRPGTDDPESDVGKTDLASVPPVLWGLLASYGRQLRAALLHDQLCEAAKKLKAADPSLAYAQRLRADVLFRMSMRDPGDGTEAHLETRVAWARSWIFFAGVSFARYWDYRRLRCVLMLLQVIAGMVFTYMMIPGVPRVGFTHWLPHGLGTHWYGYLLAVALLLVLCIVWGRDAPVPLTGLLVAPIVFPALLVSFVASRVLALPDWLASWLPDQPDVNWGPTVLEP